MAVVINGTTGITTPDVDSTADGSFNGVTVGKGAGSGATNAVLGVGAGSAMTTGARNTFLGSFSGTQSGLNLTASNNNIVLSDGSANVAVAYSQSGSGNQNIELKGNFNNAYAVPTIVAGTDVKVDCIEAVNSYSGGTYGWSMKIYFTLYQSTGSSKALRLTFTRTDSAALVGFRMLFNGEYPSDSITQYIARIATSGGGGGTYSSSNYVTGDLAAGSWTNPGGTAAFYWQQAGTPIANTGGVQGIIEILSPLENLQAFSSMTISYV
jgi:hypothetical protein